MGTANSKAVRDGLVAGAPASVATYLLMHFGVSAEVALVFAPFVAGFAARFYRALRSMDNGFGAFIRRMDDPAPAA